MSFEHVAWPLQVTHEVRPRAGQVCAGQDRAEYKTGLELSLNSLLPFSASLTMISQVHVVALALVALVIPAFTAESQGVGVGGPAAVQERQPNKRGVLDLGVGLDASPYGFAGAPVAAPVSVSKVSYATAHYPKVLAGYNGAPAIAYPSPGIAFGGPVTYADAPYYSKLGYPAAPLGYVDGGYSFGGYPGISYNGYAAVPAPGLGYGGYVY